MLPGMRLLAVRFALILLLGALIPLWLLAALLALLVAAVGDAEMTVQDTASAILAEAKGFVWHWLAMFKAPLEDEDEVNGV